MTSTVTRLVGKQARSVELATARLNIWEGPVRSSKTIARCSGGSATSALGPPAIWPMIGKAERTLKRNVDVLVDMLGKKR